MSLIGYKDKVRFNEAGQVLTFEAPQGRPSSDGTVVLYDSRRSPTDALRTILASSTASRKAVDTTVTSASGLGQTNPERVNCTPPVALAVGDGVWLTTNAGTGAMEYAEVAGIFTGYFNAVNPLRQAYALNDKIQSSVMTSPAVPTAFAQDLANISEDYEAVWTYTVGGIVYVTTTRWDIVREVFGQEVMNLERRFLRRYPNFNLYSKAQKDPGIVRRMASEWAFEADELLVRSGYADPDKVRGHERMNGLGIKWMAWQFAVDGWRPPGTSIENLQEIYDDSSGALLNGTLKIPYDVAEDGVVDADDREVEQVILSR